MNAQHYIGGTEQKDTTSPLSHVSDKGQALKMYDIKSINIGLDGPHLLVNCVCLGGELKNYFCGLDLVNYWRIY